MSLSNRQTYLYRKLLKSKLGYKEINIYLMMENKEESKIFIIEFPESNLKEKIDVLQQKNYKVAGLYDNVGFNFDKSQDLNELNQFVLKMYDKKEEDIQKMIIFAENNESNNLELEELVNFLETSILYEGIRSTEELGLYYGGTVGLLNTEEMEFTYRELGEIALKSGNYYTTKYGVLEVNN